MLLPVACQMSTSVWVIIKWVLQGIQKPYSWLETTMQTTGQLSKWWAIQLYIYVATGVATYEEAHQSWEAHQSRSKCTLYQILAIESDIMCIYGLYIQIVIISLENM